MTRFSVAKAKIVDDIESVISELLGGKNKFYRRGRFWNVRNPWRANSNEGQMIVWLNPGRRGAWKDFTDLDCKGDAVDLVAFALKGCITQDSRMAAIEWAEDRFNIRTMSPAQRKQFEVEARTKKVASEAKESSERADRRERARKFFFGCKPIDGSAAVSYLASRNIDLSAVPNLGRSLRFRPDCEYWMQDGRPKMPAMISAMVDQDGKLGACHYTFLKPDGSSKADVDKAKLMFPETTGLVIRLTDGPSGLAPDKAAEQKISGICGVLEGIEDGLSVAIAAPDLRIWAAGSLSGLLSVPDHACISAWLIFKDNDWGKPQATKLFNRAVTRIKGFGKPVQVVSMPADWGKDVNDAIRSGW